MKIALACPSCNKSALVAAEYAGRSVRCPACRHKFKVPSPDSAPVTEERQTQGGAAGEADTLDPAPPRVGRFDIKDKLGSGAFGAVYRAFDPHLQREVAVKVPRPHLLDNPRVLARFLREARAAAQLQHPAIVPVYDAGQQDGQYYIASAFIAGRTLDEVIGDVPQPPRVAAELVRQLAEGLAHAHELGIVHRDVKPANVMIDAAGRPCLMDFGLAFRPDGGEKITHDGAIMGTPSYMAPEMARGQQGEPLPASDQYALGVVLFELMTGRTPFEGPTTVVLYNAAHVAPPAPRQFSPDLPAELETICLKAMAKRPEDRYADCGAFARDLQRWLDGEPIQGRRLSLAERGRRWYDRNRRVARAGLAAAVFLLVAAIASLALHGRLEESRDRARQARVQAEGKAEEEAGFAATAEAEAARRKERAATAAKKEREAATKAKEAEEAQRQADAKAQEAEKLHRDAAEKLRAGLEPLYRAHVALAEQALAERRRADARRLLAQWLPGEKPLDLRDAGWNTMWAQVRPRCLTLPDEGGAVTALAVSPDGKTIVVGTERGEVVLRESAGGAVKRRHRIHPDAVTALAVSPDGKHLASAGGDREVVVRDLATGKEVRVLVALAPVRCVAWSADGTRLAAGDDEGRLYAWDADGGNTRRSGKLHGGAVVGVAFAPSSDKEILSVAGAKQLVAWNTTADQSRTIEVLEGEADRLAVAAGSDRYAVLPRGGLVSVRTHPSGTPGVVPQIQKSKVKALLFLGRGVRLISGDDGGLVQEWNVNTGASVPTARQHEYAVTALAADAAETLLVSGDRVGTVKVWNLQADDLLGTFPAAVGVMLSPDGGRLLSWDAAAARVHDVRTAERLESFGAPRLGALSRNFALVVSNTLVEVVEGKGGLARPIKVPAAALKGGTARFALSGDGAYAAAAYTGAAGPEVRVWRVGTGEEVANFAGPSPLVAAAQVALADDGGLVAVRFQGEKKSSVRVWSVAPPKVLLELDESKYGPLTSLAVSGDGKFLAAGKADGHVLLWDLEALKDLPARRCANTPVTAVALSMDGKHVAVAHGAGGVFAFDRGVKGEKAAFVPPEGMGTVSAVAVSDDGKVVAAAGAQVLVWRVED